VINNHGRHGTSLLRKKEHCPRAGLPRRGASASAVFVPIASVEGNKTALHVAIERREPSLARVLAKNLTPDLADATATMLTDALTEAALTMPDAVLSLLNTPLLTIRTVYTRTGPRRDSYCCPG
jgi:hypothetical protein